ncbi:MAG: hypothetical protein L3V56_01165 [Candidatus Magnetoovum sp. WYHC-5]|nr:hypothetical protein [Candidatus Magnetoovum sp. WYHC-5]
MGLFGTAVKILATGVSVIKIGSSEIIKKAEELTKEGAKQIKRFELKRDIQNQFAALGKRIYDITKGKGSASIDITADETIQHTIESIKKNEEELAKLVTKPTELKPKVRPFFTVKMGKTLPPLKKGKMPAKTPISLNKSKSSFFKKQENKTLVICKSKQRVIAKLVAFAQSSKT